MRTKVAYAVLGFGLISAVGVSLIAFSAPLWLEVLVLALAGAVWFLSLEQGFARRRERPSSGDSRRTPRVRRERAARTDSVAESVPSEPRSAPKPNSAGPFELQVSPEAIQRIRRRGGQLYLWWDPIGDWVRERTTTVPPRKERFFREHEVGGVELLIDRERWNCLSISGSKFTASAGSD